MLQAKIIPIIHILLNNYTAGKYIITGRLISNIITQYKIGYISNSYPMTK